VLPCFFGFLKRRGVRDLQGVREADVVAFLAEIQTAPSRRGTPLSLSSQRSWLKVVRVFFRHLLKLRLVIESPARDVHLPRSEALPRRVLSESQVARLLSAPSESTAMGLRDRAILELLYGTGIRLSECVWLDLSDAKLAEGELVIRQGKWRKDRVVPLGGRAGRALDRYLRDGRPEICRRASLGALFVSRISRRLGPGRLQRMMRQCSETAKLGIEVSPHMLRHACATHLLRRGASVRHVQELLGHRGLQTTTVYTKVELFDLERALRKSHPRERRNPPLL
jgi:integrase/recombinase XerD